jgi:protein gp37
MNKTKIDWADFTWNPVVGCTGTCPYCYARKMAHRFRRDFRPHWVQRNFDRPMPRKPARIFVNSMSDLADWKDEWFDKVTCKIAKHPEHLFCFLSKRPWLSGWVSLPNAMLGYSVTQQVDLDQLAKRRHGGVSFLSLEPLHGPLNLNLVWRPRWIIVGAETGNRKERVLPKFTWLMHIRNYAVMNSIPLFFKESLRVFWTHDGYFPQEYPGRDVKA